MTIPAEKTGLSGVDISYSKLNVYRACPWKYHLMYVKGRRSRPAPHTSLGLAIHHALQAFYDQPDRSWEALWDGYVDGWVHEGYESAQQTLEYYEKGRTILQRYYETVKDQRPNVVMVEKEFEFALGPHRVKGLVDRVDQLPDGRHEIIDYKTHAEPWTEDRLQNDLQLTIYLLGCEKGWNLSVGRLSYHFVSQQTVVPTTRTEDQKAQTLNLLKDTADKIIAGDFPPNHDHCVQCEFQKFCSKAQRAS